MHPSKQKLADGSLEAVDEISVVVFYTTSSWQWYKRKRLKKCLFVLKVFKLRTLLDTESITKWSLAPMAQDWSKLAASLPAAAAFWWFSELPICQQKLIKTHFRWVDTTQRFVTGQDSLKIIYFFVVVRMIFCWMQQLGWNVGAGS